MTSASPIDKLEIWNGSSYDNWLVDRTQGRAEDFWIDHEQGILFLRLFYPYFVTKVIRMGYRYGETSVPKDIRRATALHASILLLESDDRSFLVSETGDSTRLTYAERIAQYEKQIEKILHNRTEINVI